MQEKAIGTVKSIEFIQNIQPGLDLARLQIDFDSIYIYYDINELSQFLDQEVSYTIRQDMVNGKIENIICNLATITTVHTVESTTNIKLIPEGNKRTICNFNIADIKGGEYYVSKIALVTDFEMASSEKAKWIDVKMIDQSSKEFVAKCFYNKIESAESMNDVFESACGKYAQFDIQLTKYGYQIQDISVLNNVVEMSPEVVVAKEVLLNEISKDTALQQYDSMYNFINHVAQVIDGEPGYGLVRMASEIYLINAIDNISLDLNITAMKRAVFCSRGYLLPHNTKNSRMLLNTVKALKVPALKSDNELMFILDVFSEEPFSSTKCTYLKIKEMVDNIIKIRRGVNNEEIFNIADLLSTSNRLW